MIFLVVDHFLLLPFLLVNFDTFLKKDYFLEMKSNKI